MDNLNKRLQEAINKTMFTSELNTKVSLSQAAASACEKIVLQEKIDLLNEFNLLGRTNENTYRLMIASYIKSLREQLNNLP